MRPGLKTQSSRFLHPWLQVVILGGIVTLVSAPLGGCGNKPKVVDGHRRLTKKAQLAERVSQKVFLEGRVSRNPWQHLIQSPLPHAVTNYFDWKGGQIVVYAKKKLPHGKRLRVLGTIVRFTGQSKGGEIWTVYQDWPRPSPPACYRSPPARSAPRRRGSSALRPLRQPAWPPSRPPRGGERPSRRRWLGRRCPRRRPRRGGRRPCRSALRQGLPASRACGRYLPAQVPPRLHSGGGLGPPHHRVDAPQGRLPAASSTLHSKAAEYQRLPHAADVHGSVRWLD